MAFESLAPRTVARKAFPVAVENLSWLAKAVDGEEGHNCFSIGAARRENAVGRVLSPAPISPVSLGAGGQDGRDAPVVWLRKSQVPALGFASASTRSHRVGAPAARGRRAWPPESASAPPGRSRHCSAACDPGPPYGFAECLAPNPDSFLAIPHGGHRPPVAGRDESAGSKAEMCIRDSRIADRGPPSG